jgi:hypothetical protein
VLLIAGTAVIVLAVYTFFLRPRPAASLSAGLRAVSARLVTDVAAKATGPTSPSTTAAPAAALPDAAPGSAGKPSADTTAKTSLMTPRPPETWGTDPFVRDWIMVNELANFSLKAITLGGDRAYALINDQIVEEGDQISGKRIVRIESDRVTLEQGGRTFTLQLGD